MTTTTLIPPGWYPDPAQRHQYRYWDGHTWTDQASDAGRVVADVPALRTAPEEETSLAATPAAPPGPVTAAPVPTKEPTAAPQAPWRYAPTPEYRGPDLPGPPPKRRSGDRGLWFGALAAGAALVLLAGLLIWSPWSGEPPARPTGLDSDFPTATSVRLSWEAAAGDTTVTRFVVQRDGQEIGTVRGTETSYVDSGLTSASTHSYVVFAVSEDGRSDGSTAVNVRMPSPVPTHLRVTGVTPASVILRWSPPRVGTPPDSYVVFRDDAIVETVSASRTTYLDKGLSPATRYAYTVAASWGTDESAPVHPAAAVSVRTRTPSLASARLSGSWSVSTTIVRSGGGSTDVGDRFTDTWRFRPSCRSGACDVRLSGTIGGSSYVTHRFRMDLQRRPGGVYSGSTTAHITHCGNFPMQIDVRNGMQISVTIRKGGVDGGVWSASRWQGSMTVTSPYVQATPTTYCPGQSFTGHVRAQR